MYRLYRMYQALCKSYKKDLDAALSKYNVLKDLDIFVLDNSIRESTVGQLTGHTIEAKWELYEEVKKCGFDHTIVASFNHTTRVDDVFIKQLVEKGENLDGLWAFSEITDGSKNKVPDTETVPIGLLKLQEVGMYNVIFEIDLGDTTYDFDKFPMEKMTALVEKWVTWCHDHLKEDAKVFISFRDLPDVMPDHPERMFQMMEFLSKLPERLRLFGIMFEEPRGKSLPEECGMWARYMRKIMDENNWKGHILAHVHEKFGYADATTLQILMDGANGIWASVCKEGASMGNASSIVTLINLIRLGNKKVLKKYKCEYLRQAAINVTKLSIGKMPADKQPIYGTRALDMVFDLNEEEFDLASFFGEKAPVRITTMASGEMIMTRMKNLFGEDPQFTTEMGTKMREKILEDLRNNRKEEYMSKLGLAMLFDRAGGQLTATMSEIIANTEVKKAHFQNIIDEIRRRWDEWDLRDKEKGDEMLQYDSFYNGFMAPYFACYRCSDTKAAICAMDMDADNHIDWNEFMVYVRWALNEYPECQDADEALDIAFRKGLIPAMRDEMLKKQTSQGAA